MKKITVLCHYGCGTEVETIPQHKDDAVCEPCSKAHHQKMSNEARRIRNLKNKPVKEFDVEEWALWGN